MSPGMLRRDTSRRFIIIIIISLLRHLNNVLFAVILPQACTVNMAMTNDSR